MNFNTNSIIAIAKTKVARTRIKVVRTIKAKTIANI